MVVLENSEVCDSLGHAFGDQGRVIAPDPEQYQKTGRDLSGDAAIHGYPRAAYTLDNCSHLKLQNFLQ
jgi:hypothetical protein